MKNILDVVEGCIYISQPKDRYISRIPQTKKEKICIKISRTSMWNYIKLKCNYNLRSWEEIYF